MRKATAWFFGWILGGFALYAQPYTALHTLNGHRDAVSYVCFHPSGTVAASGDKDGVIRLWEVVSGAPKIQLIGHQGFITHLVFNKAGNLLASASYDGTVKLWNTATGALVKSFENPGIPPYGSFKGNEPTFVLFDKEENHLFFGGYNAKIYKANIRTGELKLVYQDYLGGILSGVLLGSDSSLVVSVLREVLYIDPTTGQVQQTKSYADNVCELLFHAGSERLFAWIESGKIAVWKGNTLETEWQATTKKGSSPLAVAPDGSFLITGNDANKVHLWKLSDNSKWQTLDGHSAAVNAYAISSDKKYIVTGSEDKRVKIWQLSTPPPPVVPVPPAPVVPPSAPERQVMVKEELAVSANRLTIEIWDYEEYDGDTVTVLFNDMVLLNKQLAKTAKQKFEVPMPPNGEGLLVVHAHNEGRIPPNTVAVSIKDGGEVQIFQVQSSLSTSEAIKVVRRAGAPRIE